MLFRRNLENRGLECDDRHGECFNIKSHLKISVEVKPANLEKDGPENNRPAFS